MTLSLGREVDNIEISPIVSTPPGKSVDLALSLLGRSRLMYGRSSGLLRRRGERFTL